LEHPAKNLRIQRRRIEGVPAAAIRETVRAKDALAWFLAAMAELRATVKAQNLVPTGVLGGIYANSLFSHGRGEATLFIPCLGAVRSTARVSGCLVPQTEVAALVHQGSYANVDMTYGALATYVARHALPLHGPIREYYLYGPEDTADESAWRTEIGWPIFHTG
jgi:effector-binding domain-containing protein